MSQLKEKPFQADNLTQDLTHAQDLATTYQTLVNSQRYERDQLNQQSNADEDQMRQVLQELGARVRGARVRASELDVQAARNEFVSTVAHSALERLSYKNDLIQGLGQLSLKVLDRVQGDEAKIEILYKLAQSTDLPFFFHPATDKTLNVVTAKDQRSRFTIGSGGMIGLAVFDEPSGDIVDTDFLMSGGNLYGVDRRVFSRERVPQRKALFYRGLTTTTNSGRNFDLTSIAPVHFIETFGEQYDVMNAAVQQMVAESV